MRNLGCWMQSAVIVGVVAGLGVSRALAVSAQSSTYRLDTYALQLNGEAQFVSGLAGGFVDGTVVTENGAVLMPKKHLGGATVEPVRVRVRPDQFTQFLADSLAGKAGAATGTIYYIDNSGKVQQQRALTRVMLSELAFPGLTGSSRPANALFFTIALAAESAKTADPLAGALPPAQLDNSPGARAKRWAGDWRFQVPGLPTNRVSRIEPFTLRRKAVVAPGELRDPEGARAQWEVPNLVFYMPTQDSQAWVAWHDDFVVQGHNADAQEKTFTLQLLASNLQDTLLQLEGSGVGIVSAKYEQSLDANAPPASGFRVELYVETMKLTTVPGSASPAASAPAVPGAATGSGLQTGVLPGSATSRPVPSVPSGTGAVPRR